MPLELLRILLLALLDRIRMPDRFLGWATRYLATKRKDDASLGQSIRESQSQRRPKSMPETAG